MIQVGRSRVQFPMRSLDFSNSPTPSSRTMALGSTQPLTEMSTGNLPGGKGRPALKADLTAICEQIFYKMWEPRRLTALWASTACYRDSFTFFTFISLSVPSLAIAFRSSFCNRLISLQSSFIFPVSLRFFLLFCPSFFHFCLTFSFARINSLFPSLIPFVFYFHSLFYMNKTFLRAD
jgi:hypothetical protein